MQIRSLVSAAALGGCLALTAGCGADQPGQIETIQLFARALRSKAPRLACAALVPSLRDEISCDSVVVPLMHYSKGFAGSKVERRGPSSGWRFSQTVTVPIRYQGPDGEGAVDFTMQRQKDGQWRIALAMPVL